MQIDDSVASLVIAQLLFLQSESNKKPIHMYINSPGEQGLPWVPGALLGTSLVTPRNEPPIRDVHFLEKEKVWSFLQNPQSVLEPPEAACPLLEPASFILCVVFYRPDLKINVKIFLIGRFHTPHAPHQREKSQSSLSMYHGRHFSKRFTHI